MGNVKIRRGTKAPTAVSRVEVSGRATYRTRATPRTTTPLAAAGEKKGSRRKATPAPVSTATGRRGARGPRGGGGGGATSSRRRSRVHARSSGHRSAPARPGSRRLCEACETCNSVLYMLSKKCRAFPANLGISPVSAVAGKPKSRRASGVSRHARVELGGRPLARASLRDRRHEVRREEARSW